MQLCLRLFLKTRTVGRVLYMFAIPERSVWRMSGIHSLFLWNPINLIDGEAYWVAWGVIYITTALLLSKVLGIALRHGNKKFDTSSFYVFSTALYTPAIAFIWYLAALYSIDLVTDAFFSQARPRLWAILLNGGGVITLGWFLFRLKNLFIAHALETRREEGKAADAHSIQAISKLFTVVIGVIIVILLNDFTGMNLTALLAFGGVGGLALAFASQEIVSNFFGGFMVHMTRSFLIGEELALPSLNIAGIVEEIGWYQTRIRPASKEAVYIPNSLFSKALLINKTRVSHRLFNETIWLEIQPAASLNLITREVDLYMAKHPRFDHTQWSGCRIESIGPSSSIVVAGLMQSMTLQEFYRIRGDILLNLTGIITSHGGTITHSPTVIKS